MTLRRSTPQQTTTACMVFILLGCSPGPSSQLQSLSSLASSALSHHCRGDGQRHGLATTTTTITDWTNQDDKEGGQIAKPVKEAGGDSTGRRRSRIPVLRYENDWVCVNKPAGMSVHPSGRRRRPLVPVLTSRVKRQLARKVFPVHRLDHRTSGALLLAFDSQTCGNLHFALQHSTAHKAYIALVRGHFCGATGDDKEESDSVVVDSPVTVNGISKPAVTRFTRLASGIIFDDNDEEDRTDGNRDSLDGSPEVFFSLLLCEPETGRLHQIRRHARLLSHPIIGDTEHGDSRINRWWRLHRGLDRLGLHCIKLDLPALASSQEEERMHIVAPLPDEFRSVLNHPDMPPHFWQEAIQKFPLLATPEIDLRSGTHGRHFRRKQQMAASTTGQP